MYAEHYNDKGERLQPHISKLKVSPKMNALDVKNNQFASDEISGQVKADALKKYLKNHGLGPYLPKSHDIKKAEFQELSANLRKTFQNEDTLLMSGLDKNNLAYRGPVNSAGDMELIVQNNNLFNLHPITAHKYPRKLEENLE